MSDIYIRKVNADTKERLKQLAMQKNMSLSEYCSIIFDSFVINPEVILLDKNYKILAENMLNFQKKYFNIFKDIIDKNNEVLQKIEEKLVNKNG